MRANGQGAEALRNLLGAHSAEQLRSNEALWDDYELRAAEEQEDAKEQQRANKVG